MEKSPNPGSYVPPTSVIPVALLEKSGTFPKRRIIAEIKTSWIFKFLETIQTDYIEGIAILCTDEPEPTMSAISFNL